MLIWQTVVRRGQLPRASGVYVFYDGDQCLYVGESVNIRRRIASHERKREMPKGYVLQFALCSDHKAEERRLIAELKPLKNGLLQRAKIIHPDIPMTDERWERFEDFWTEFFGEKPSWLTGALK